MSKPGLRDRSNKQQCLPNVQDSETSDAAHGPASKPPSKHTRCSSVSTSTSTQSRCRAKFRRKKRPGALEPTRHGPGFGPSTDETTQPTKPKPLGLSATGPEPAPRGGQRGRLRRSAGSRNGPHARGTRRRDPLFSRARTPSPNRSAHLGARSGVLDSS